MYDDVTTPGVLRTTYSRTWHCAGLRSVTSAQVYRAGQDGRGGELGAGTTDVGTVLGSAVEVGLSGDCVDDRFQFSMNPLLASELSLWKWMVKLAALLTKPVPWPPPASAQSQQVSTLYTGNAKLSVSCEGLLITQ